CPLCASAPDTAHENFGAVDLDLVLLAPDTKRHLLLAQAVGETLAQFVYATFLTVDALPSTGLGLRRREVDVLIAAHAPNYELLQFAQAAQHPTAEDAAINDPAVLQTFRQA